jgi:hypothetical protein
MALSYVTYPSDGVTVQYDIPFGYLRKQHVFAFVDDELRGFKWISGTRIELLVAPAPDATIRLQRLTERATRVTTFTDGQTLLAGDLNAGDLQNFYVMQELIDQIADAILLGDLTVLNPDGGWVTAAWIAEQIDASAPPAALADLADLIAQEELARAAAVTAEAQARVDGLLAEALARANALAIVDAALITETEQRVTAVDSLITSLNILIARTDDAEAAIVAEQTARATADTAIVTDLNALTARTDTAEADVISLGTAIANETSARAEAIGIVTAAVGENAAGITAVEEALVSEGLTRASAVTSLSAQMSSMGSGGNLCFNSLMSGAAEAGGSEVFPDGWGNWATNDPSWAGTKGTSGTSAWTGYTLPGEHTYYCFQPGTDNTGAVYDYRSEVVHAQPGDRVIASYLSGAHGCKASLLIAAINSSGTEVRFVDGTENDKEQFGGTTVSSWKRLVAYTDLQAGEVGFRLIMRKWQTTSPNTESYLFACRPMLEIGHPTQISPSPYAPDGKFSTKQATDNKSSIVTVQNAQVTDNAARASEISSVSATLSSRPSGGNIMTNPAMSDITASWSTSAGSAGATGSFPYYVPHPKMPRGWTAYSTSGITDSKQFTIYSPNASVWLPRGVAGFMFYQNGNTAAGYAEAYSVMHPCSVGQRVAVAMRASIHNCTATVYAFFYNSAGTYLGVGTGSTGTFTSGSNPGPAGGGVEDFVRLTRFTTAPDTTRYMRLVIRKNYTTSGSSSYLFASCPQIMFVPDDATDLPPFDGMGDVSGALTAGVAETKVAITDSTGAYSYYGIKVNAGDNSVASIEAMSDTKTSISKLKLKADKIEMEGDVIINGSLYTEQLALGAVSNVGVDQGAGEQAVPNNSWFVAAEFTFTTVGIGVEIRATCVLTNGGTVGGAGTIGTHQPLLQRSGGGQPTVNLVSPGISAPEFLYGDAYFSYGGTNVLMDYNDIVPAGTYTYKLFCRSVCTLGSSIRTVDRAYLSLREFKR